MTPIPNLPDVNIEPLYEIAKGTEKFILLKTAVDFNVFDFFNKPQPAQEFVDKAQTDFDLTEKFLNALVAMGLLAKEDSLYNNTPLASACLIKDKPFFQGNMLELMYKSREDRWANLGNCLKEGPIQPDRNKSQVFNGKFIVAMAEGAMRGDLHQTVKVVSRLPEFNRSKKLVDLGGGHGLYAIAFSQANPELESVVFDLPQVSETTKAYIDEYEMQSRVKAVSGDYTKDDWGKGYDIVFASDALYKPKEELLPVLTKIRESLNPGGLFISKHWMMNKERTSPDTTVLFDLMLSLTRGFSGYTYCTEESVELFKHAGFDIETFDISSPSKPSVIIVCRKGE